MDIKALRHLATVTRAIAGERRILVCGSASFFGTVPDATSGFESSRRSLGADYIVQPFDEGTGRMLLDSIGEDGAFAAQFGYHADIVRPSIAETFPPGYESQLVALSGCEDVYCLDPHDMAVAKLIVGRPKDVELTADLLRAGYVEAEKLRELLRETPMAEATILKSHRCLADALRAAGWATERD